MQPGGFDPHGRGFAFSRGAAPLCRVAFLVGSGECPLAVLAAWRLVIAAHDCGCLPQWDHRHDAALSARVVGGPGVSGAELTPPYALLLVEGLFEQAEAEAQAIQANNRPTTNNRAGSAPDERSADPVSIYEQMAEGGGFEPPRRGLPAWRFSRPLHSTALPPFHAKDEG